MPFNQIKVINMTNHSNQSNLNPLHVHVVQANYGKTCLSESLGLLLSFDSPAAFIFFFMDDLYRLLPS